MNCEGIAAILDTHRSTRLTAAERTAVDTHLITCGDCAAAWHAQTELAELSLPPVPAALLERALRAARVQPAVAPRRWRATFVVGSALLAGAALAATMYMTLTRSTDEAPPEAAAAPSTAPVAREADAAASRTDAAPPESAPRATSVELVEIPLAIAPIAIRPPDYPPDALARGLGGHVQLKFDVTTAGRVENVSVVESSDPIFEESALRAITNWRYLPKIAAGKRVASSGIHTILRFEPGAAKPPATPAQRQAADDAASAAQRESAAFSAGLEVALDRFAADDLRGSELQLDEMYALYDNELRRGALWNFYGHLYTVGGNYDRAIDAYESAIAATRGGVTAQNQWMSLASLYFARHQYDMALRTLLNYEDRLAELRVQHPERPRWPTPPEVVAFIERLRALGVTKETLPR
jgi:TonB family protein